jgi:hypothetical protein
VIESLLPFRVLRPLWIEASTHAPDDKFTFVSSPISLRSPPAFSFKSLPADQPEFRKFVLTSHTLELVNPVSTVLFAGKKQHRGALG